MFLMKNLVQSNLVKTMGGVKKKKKKKRGQKVSQ